MLEIILLIVLGALTGLGASFLGIGGGFILVPLLPSIYEFTAQQTVMISFLNIFWIVCVNTVFYLRKKMVDTHLFLLIAPISVVSSIIFIHIGSFIPDFFLRLALLILLIIAILDPFRWIHIKKNLLSGLGFGSVAGGLGVTVGVGMTVLTPLLYQSRWIDSKKIAPTANAIMAFNCLFSCWFFIWKVENFDWSVGLNVLVWVIPSALLAAMWGRKLNNHQHNIKRKWIFKVILLALTLKVTEELFLISDLIKKIGIF